MDFVIFLRISRKWVAFSLKIATFFIRGLRTSVLKKQYLLLSSNILYLNASLHVVEIFYFFEQFFREFSFYWVYRFVGMSWFPQKYCIYVNFNLNTNEDIFINKMGLYQVCFFIFCRKPVCPIKSVRHINLALCALITNDKVEVSEAQKLMREPDFINMLRRVHSKSVSPKTMDFVRSLIKVNQSLV